MLQLAECTAIALIASTVAEAAAPLQTPSGKPAASVTEPAIPHAQTAAASAAATATNSDWVITLNVQLDVSKVDPSNATVGLDCTALLTTQQRLSADGVTSGTVDAATYHKDIEMRPQGMPYRTAAVGAALVNGEYHGLQTVTFKFNPAQATFQMGNGPVDAVVVGCRLLLSNAVAIMDPHAGLGANHPQYVTSGAIALVQTHAIEWQTP